MSTEITGYVASALVFLYQTTGEERYLDAARRAAGFLCDRAWDSALRTFPFEYPGSTESYFFDCGIIVRGLLSVWRVTKEDRLVEIASAASHGMIEDFRSAEGYHPILALPSKSPHERALNWSRSSGCYQTKSALAWWEVAEITGDRTLREAYLENIAEGIRTHRDFLPGTPERLRVMDRLHAYSYFLEALSPLLDRADCVAAYAFTLLAVSQNLRAIAPDFARSDVYAQLLRARVYGSLAIPVDTALAREEAVALRTFQCASADPRTDGAFFFGRRDGHLVPHANPVSTAFAAQALEVWRAYEAGEANPCAHPTI